MWCQSSRCSLTSVFLTPRFASNLDHHQTRVAKKSNPVQALQWQSVRGQTQRQISSRSSAGKKKKKNSWVLLIESISVALNAPYEPAGCCCVVLSRWRGSVAELRTWTLNTDGFLSVQPEKKYKKTILITVKWSAIGRNLFPNLSRMHSRNEEYSLPHIKNCAPGTAHSTTDATN